MLILTAMGCSPCRRAARRAQQLVESPGDWAERLGGDGASPQVGRFIYQLDAEWNDAWPPDRLCVQVTEQVRARMAAWHPGWPHLWAHVLRVTGLAVALAEDAGQDPALAYLTGICHDVAKLYELRTILPHEEEGSVFAADSLRGHLPGAQIARSRRPSARMATTPGAHPQRRRQAGQDRGGGGGAPYLDGRIVLVYRVALGRVADDAEHFPPMHFARSRSSRSAAKRAFVAVPCPQPRTCCCGEHGPGRCARAYPYFRQSGTCGVICRRVSKPAPARPILPKWDTACACLLADACFQVC